MFNGHINQEEKQYTSVQFTASGGCRARSKVTDLGSSIDFSANEPAYLRWLNGKRLNKTYRRDLLNYVKNYLTTPINDENELMQILSKNTTDGLRIAIRSFLNFLVESNIMNEDTANRYRKVLKNRHKVNPDNFVPDDSQVVGAFKRLTSERERVVFKILAHSGIRQTEVMKMLNEWDTSRLIVNNTIAKYSLNWTRGQKKIFYVYLPKDFALNLHRFYSTRKMIDVIGKKGGLNLKYLRKWQYNTLIMNNTPEGVADYIQGRSAESVGSMHYLAKAKQADFWYEKITEKLTSLLP